MNHEAWEAHLSISRKVESGGRNNDGNEDPHIIAQQREFIEVFKAHLPPPARILAPGAVCEALLLAEAGYEVHSLVLGPDNVAWVKERMGRLPNPDLLRITEQDGHQLDYPDNFFDGYFSIQVHEHWLAPIVHICEFRFCARDGAVVFVDACGTTNEACKIPWHVNLVPEQTVKEQWEYAGFEVMWTGPYGDDRPQFIFRKLQWGHPLFKNSGYLRWVHRLRRGERVEYAYSCPHCPGK